ncbi:MAG: hypothetical protein ABI042_19620 [Verrucomicrobiota bacterium]
MVALRFQKQAVPFIIKVAASKVLKALVLNLISSTFRRVGNIGFLARERMALTLYGHGSTPIEIDDDVREEYWREIRGKPEKVHEHAT